jgi:hypothetical protein
VLQSQTHLLATGEDELVEVVEDKFERLRVCLVDLDYLRDAARVEGLVLDVSEVAEDFFDLVLHHVCTCNDYTGVFKYAPNRFQQFIEKCSFNKHPQQKVYEIAYKLLAGIVALLKSI